MLAAIIFPCKKHSELADRQWGLHRNLALDKLWAPPTMALLSEGHSSRELNEHILK